jgi:hypothetical protein
MNMKNSSSCAYVADSVAVNNHSKLRIFEAVELWLESVVAMLVVNKIGCSSSQFCFHCCWQLWCGISGCGSGISRSHCYVNAVAVAHAAASPTPTPGGVVLVFTEAVISMSHFC